ncbi:MAG: hypothetical protein JXC32_17875 [Anaerolineae bacterium]|nr:hypothetical protein [Anaerolineae bacterium]
MQTTQIGTVTVSKLILGGNPFSGFSHQNPARDREMVEWYSTARIKETMREAEALGINTFLGRADRHVRRTLQEYWFEGGKIQWFAQTAPEFSSLSGNIAGAVSTGAKAVYLHGGQMDFLLAQNQLDVAVEAIRQIKAAGVAAGVAGHNPRVHLWANEHLDLDFHMCSYYNPTPRDKNAEHVHGATEVFDDADRAAMTDIIPELLAPVIHYKIFAAGRKNPKDAFAYVAQHLRPQDAVCIGVFTKDKAEMLAEDMVLFERALER